MRNHTSRDRMVAALAHREPDRVPLDLGGLQSGITATAYDRLKPFYRVESETIIMERIQQLASINDVILEKLNIDTRYIFARPSASWDPQEHRDLEATSYVDEWGTRWKKPSTSYYYDPVGFPLAEAGRETLDRHSWPDGRDPHRTEGLAEKARAFQEQGYAVGTCVSGVFEQCWYLTGLERIMMGMIEAPDFVEALMNKVLEVQMDLYANTLEKVGTYLDFLEIWEDLSSQQGPLVSREMFRKIIKPRTEQLIRFIKSKTEAKIALHSCGSISWAIEDFIDIGVEILNPVQVAAANMDTAELKKRYGNVLSFWGGIDTQYVLPQGTVEEVRDEVKRRIDDLAPGGGYLLAPVHNIQPDVPPQNIIAMYETALEYGGY